MMMQKLNLLLILLSTTITIVYAPDPSCILTSRSCTNFPKFDNKQFEDKYAKELLGLDNPSACYRRAEDFHHWCGNGREKADARISATWVSGTFDTQVYHPTACDPEWSLYHGNCYVHVWRAKTWWEAEEWCNKHNAHLCSIHGKAENEFVFTLTKGLSSWIGYNDNNQDEEYQWSDNSKTDFENMAKNCTGREHEPDCAPMETAQQWYDWNGADRGTWVCKKPAKWGIGILRNITSLEGLAKMDWEKLKVPLSQIPTQPVDDSLASQELEEIKPQRKAVMDLGNNYKPQEKIICEDCD